MRLFFQESCDLCSLHKQVGYGDYYYTDRTEIVNGESFPIPFFVENKTAAKKWFINYGWVYYHQLIFCKECFSKLKNGYVVVDRFNQLYSEEGSSDMITANCIMKKEIVEEFIKYTYNQEVVEKKKALSFACKFLKGEIDCDAVGYAKAHPDAIFIMG